MKTKGRLLGFGSDHMVAQFRGDRYWAERGLIHIETSDNRYDTLSVRAFLHRVKGLVDMVGNSHASRKGVFDEATRQDYQRFFEEAEAIAKLAQEQGMPSDKTARHAVMNSRPKTVCVGAGKAFM